MIRLAFDARETSHMSAGVLNYSRKLREWLPRVAPEIEVIALGSGDNFDLAEQIGLPLAIARSRAQLAHFPTLFVPRFVPAPYIVTVHDLIDLHFPQFVKPQVPPYVRALVAPVVRGARAVITDDEATVDDLERFLGVDARRVRVIPLGNDDPPDDPIPIGHPRPYLLYVGNRRPHKNLATLIAAWSELARERAVDLVLSGSRDAAATVASPGAGEIVFLGERSDAELRRWYAGAAAYVHPALREGFGLPLLEAMRNGARVIASREAMPRVLAPHAVLVEALDVAGWRSALAAVLDDPAGAHAAALAARAATSELTWERTARLTADVYRMICP
ncbi:MAG TPA: glycosyltransferase family 1 protein [Candidatus Lustribacter sp.]|jgi:glycosyltransferase involved in cell wall biosynthesis|nr:glycosyltransferase family 1 protein [Candidatus Lustribacter sp.]